MIDERKDKLGEQSEEQVNIQELLFRYLYCLCMGIPTSDNTYI